MYWKLTGGKGGGKGQTTISNATTGTPSRDNVRSRSLHTGTWRAVCRAATTRTVATRARRPCRRWTCRCCSCRCSPCRWSAPDSWRYRRNSNAAAEHNTSRAVFRRDAGAGGIRSTPLFALLFFICFCFTRLLRPAPNLVPPRPSLPILPPTTPPSTLPPLDPPRFIRPEGRNDQCLRPYLRPRCAPGVIY